MCRFEPPGGEETFLKCCLATRVWDFEKVFLDLATIFWSMPTCMFLSLCNFDQVK